MRTFFGKELDISDELIVVNGRLGQSNEMKDFKTILRDTTNEIKVGGLRVLHFVFCMHSIASIRLFKTYLLFREMRSEMGRGVCVCGCVLVCVCVCVLGWGWLCVCWGGRGYVCRYGVCVGCGMGVWVGVCHYESRH